MDDELAPWTEGHLDPMTVSELANILVDEFHDWNDGDDWPIQSDYAVTGPNRFITVTFASGEAFTILIEPA
jgi:hypothetical protein